MAGQQAAHRSAIPTQSRLPRRAREVLAMRGWMSRSDPASVTYTNCRGSIDTATPGNEARSRTMVSSTSLRAETIPRGSTGGSETICSSRETATSTCSRAREAQTCRIAATSASYESRNGVDMMERRQGGNGQLIGSTERESQIDQEWSTAASKLALRSSSVTTPARTSETRLGNCG